jgi:hypothetical protein
MLAKRTAIVSSANGANKWVENVPCLRIYRLSTGPNGTETKSCVREGVLQFSDYVRPIVL